MEREGKGREGKGREGKGRYIFHKPGEGTGSKIIGNRFQQAAHWGIEKGWYR